jgi:hypothetical protein
MAHPLMGRKDSLPAQMPTRNRFSLARDDAVVLGQSVARAVIGSALGRTSFRWSLCEPPDPEPASVRRTDVAPQVANVSLAWDLQRCLA